jgi:hypothetical protein
MPRKRHDPPKTLVPADGGEYTDDQFFNLRHDLYHYVCANPNDAAGGVPATDRYLARQYEQVIAVEGGERPATGRVTLGQPIVHLGQWLMRCPIELFMERARKGQRRAEEFDKQTRKNHGLDEGFGGRRYYEGELPGDGAIGA